MKEEVEYWFEPILNIHTPLSSRFHLNFLFAYVQLGSQNNVLCLKKHWRVIWTPHPEVTPVLNAIALCLSNSLLMCICALIAETWRARVEGCVRSTDFVVGIVTGPRSVGTMVRIAARARDFPSPRCRSSLEAHLIFYLMNTGILSPG